MWYITILKYWKWRKKSLFNRYIKYRLQLYYRMKFKKNNKHFYTSTKSHYKRKDSLNIVKMKTITKKYIISVITIMVSYFLINLLKPDPHINNFIPLFIIRILFIIIGFFLIIYTITKNNKIIYNYLFIITLLINLTSIIEIILTLSDELFFYIIMFISILIATIQIYLISKVKK